jgi:hypothetical protein
VLSGMLRWPAVERIWMPAWLADRDAVLAALETAFTAALARADGSEPPPVPETRADDHQGSDTFEPSIDLLLPADDETETADDDHVPVAPLRVAAPLARSGNALQDRPLLDEPFTAWEPRQLGTIEDLDRLPARGPGERVAAALRDVVETEGPVHFDRLVKLVASSFGLGRVSEARGRAIMRLLDPDLRADGREPFAWPQRLDPEAWRGYRPTPDGLDRPIEQISQREVVNAMAAICSASAGISPEELKREALRVFGGRRMTTNIAAYLTSALELGCESGRLVVGAEGLVTAGY